MQSGPEGHHECITAEPLVHFLRETSTGQGLGKHLGTRLAQAVMMLVSLATKPLNTQGITEVMNGGTSKPQDGSNRKLVPGMCMGRGGPFLKRHLPWPLPSGAPNVQHPYDDQPNLHSPS